ncbi:hypothetical protein Tco_0871799 [Tanacetum coccineum]
MVIENKVKTLTITTFLLLAKKVLRATVVSRISCLHPPILLLSHLIMRWRMLFPLKSISPFHNDPYMKVIQAYDAIASPQAIITLPAVLPLSSVLSLSQMFDSQDFFPLEEISPPKDTKTPVKYPIPVSLSSSVGSSSPVRLTTSPPDYPFDESIFVELDNSLWIIPRPLGSEPNPEEPNESDAC